MDKDYENPGEAGRVSPDDNYWHSDRSNHHTKEEQYVVITAIQKASSYIHNLLELHI